MFEPTDDVEAAGWIVDRLHPFGRDAGSFVPEGFASYLRLLHPPARAHEAGPGPRWKELARRTSTELTAQTRFEQLEAGLTEDLRPPLTGTLDSEMTRALLPLLTSATTTPERCWFGLWEGFGALQGVPGAHVALPERPLVLRSGPLQAVLDLLDPPLMQSPTLWWPEDRAWCVASEVDFHSTYVGGSTALCEQIMREPRLEALPLTLTDHVTD